MDIKEYAPVVITTLNRYAHFKRCLDSLERCTGAKQTDVYVGLDFPPSEKYVEGWKKIDEYLKGKEEKNGFRNLVVRRRDHNCGVGKPGSNGSLLFGEVREVYDRYISSEDDNEFSPCFLEYINKALEKYKDDPRVMCVCGYSPFDDLVTDNVFFARQMYAWGIGRWQSKSKEIKAFRNLESLEKVLKDYNSAMKIYRYRPVMLSRVMDQVIKGKIFPDVCYTCFCVLNDRYCIYPSKTLVKNWGSDGSGLHSKKVADKDYENRVINRALSQDTSFEIDDVEVGELEKIRSKFSGFSSKKWYGNYTIILRYFVWRLTKKDIFAIIRR